MHAARRAQGQPWEFAVALFGVLSSALLVALALAPSNDPQHAGRAAFARHAGEVEDAVAAEWARLREDPDGFALAEATRWSEADLDALAELRESRSSEHGSQPAAPESTVFELLLGEAQRLEAQGEVGEARTAALDARTRADHPAGRARATLVAIRCARQLGEHEAARAAWNSVAGELQGGEFDAHTPLLAACAIAAAPSLDREAAAALQARLVDALIRGELALEVEPFRSAWLERIETLAKDEAAAERLREHERLRRLVELSHARPADRLPERPPDRAWRFEPQPARNALLAWRADGLDSVLAGFVTRADVLGAFAARLERLAVLPDGFALDFGLAESTSSGVRVRERRELDAAGIEFELLHADPEAAATRAGQRVALFRGALFLTAALSAVASFATFRALRRSRKLAELKSSFVASVSHELRTPVASILMLAENLEAGRVSEPAARARYASLIRREAERLRRLVADVLDFSRLERGRQLELRRESRALAPFLAELGDAAREWARKHDLELELDFGAVAPAAASVHVDDDALRRAIENLLDNARKHSGSGQIALRARTERAALHFEVRDRGRGLAPEQRARVFEPFERLDSANGAGGAGLGLAIVREIARGHGGEARALEPQDGVGARMELEIPLEHTSEIGA